MVRPFGSGGRWTRRAVGISVVYWLFENRARWTRGAEGWGGKGRKRLLEVLGFPEADMRANTR